MVQYTSFRDYLDKYLPGFFTIQLKQFFSFLPFIKPVNPQLIELRRLVERAKSTPNFYDYVNYFNKSITHSGIFSGFDSFIYSQEEFAALESGKVPSAATVGSSLKILPIVSVSSAEKIDYVKQVVDLLEKQPWQVTLNHFLSSIEEKEVITLIKNFLSQYPMLGHEQKGSCILFLVNYLNLDKKNLISQVFNGLNKEKDILHYRQLLQIKSTVYVGELLASIDLLGRHPLHEKQKYAVQRDFLQLKYKLRDLRDGKAIYEIPEILAHLEKAFREWEKGHSINDEKTQNVIDEIYNALQNLKDIIDDFETIPGLKESFFKDEKSARANLLLMEERQEFAQKMRRGEIAVVSIQRLKELYPNEESYQQVLKQCHKFGISVFDALDLEQKKQALREHNAMKYLSSQL
ncbi:hypothetical protein [Legionella jamestowniensis]|uniref:Uncharacterized protein n=1 Tax=Legionella jamestowniensis TaxID=455 RepID=A0A0W0UTX6_9GAMM|nr:hypothetical protein [Legionella jamestowniensis]KTD11316.1 hypothetical protein Ljam_0510 [Legionella jamestowniensis]SFL69189.1 hypothetical protein SAMN02746073_1403 [Legionella jamestowniensis DSM 19215]